MAICKLQITFLFLTIILVSANVRAEEEPAVIELTESNFTEIVEKHDFIVVEFYAPWCGHCKKLAPEYEKAAQELLKHDPPITLAKVDANEKSNKPLSTKFNVQGFPTIKILRNKGAIVQDYNGAREKEGIVEYLKKQVGPASVELKSEEEAEGFIGEKSVVIVGVFDEFSGSEFENFISIAEKLRAEYNFGHSKDAKILPRGDSSLAAPFVRLFKPFDDLFADSKEFEVEKLESFINEASMPLVVTFDSNPSNQPFLLKFFSNSNVKAMLFTSFTDDKFTEYKKELNEAAVEYKSKNLSFLIGEPTASRGAFQYYGLRNEWLPLIVVQGGFGQKYLKSNVQPDQIQAWLKEYLDGTLTPFIKSQPIPETNDEPVKIVVAESFNETVFNSGKNVFLEFYAPWCSHCKKLEPILNEVATSLQNKDNIVIAKMDATLNDVPKEFELTAYPTIYFYSADKKMQVFNGGRTAEAIIHFINENKYPSETAKETESVIEETTQPETETVKDEL
ncbi:hypothetical protein LUZ60_004271 [Juncus effusus]|nr:hypothetical protein LUZ60_004271 [Juncus effusus]